MTGLNEIIYYYGYFGLVLMVLSLLSSLYKSIQCKSWNGILCIVYAALVASSDVVGFIMIAFWFSIISIQRNRKEKMVET